MDSDLEQMSREELITEAKTLRNGIRAHRDSTGHDLCWHHPALWGLLPERTDPMPTVPEWPKFMQGCIRYRQSLDEQAPNAPRTGGSYKEAMMYDAINIARKFSLFKEQWQPKVIAEMNDYQFKIAKLQGDFVWHDHRDSDETFLVIDGRLRIDFRGGSVELGPGEMYVVPKGVEHKPYAESEAKVMLIEPRGVRNTGERGGERTAENDVWI